MLIHFTPWLNKGQKLMKSFRGVRKLWVWWS